MRRHLQWIIGKRLGLRGLTDGAATSVSPLRSVARGLVEHTVEPRRVACIATEQPASQVDTFDGAVLIAREEAALSFERAACDDVGVAVARKESEREWLVIGRGFFVLLCRWREPPVSATPQGLSRRRRHRLSVS
jgi:hypothetical protein